MRQFAPVHLPEGRRLNERASQTFLAKFNLCPRSAYLYQLGKGSQTPEMARGSALHEIQRRAVALLEETAEATIPPELVKAIAVEVLSETPVPIEEHDRIREMAYRWAAETAVDPLAVVANETLFVMDVDGFEIRCRLDFAEVLDEGSRVVVRDTKSSKAAVGYEEIARKRSDGTLAAKSFQLVLYAVVLAYGVPVEVEECPPQCWGRNAKGVPLGRGGTFCEQCNDTHVIERREPFPVASRAQRFDLEFVYPGIEDRDGKMLRRGVDLSRAEVDEYRDSLVALVRNVRRSEETGDWPALSSDQACSECPARSLCPIPAEFRSYAGAINTIEEAAEAGELLYQRKARNSALQKELRLWCKANGVRVPFGNEMVWDFVPKTADTIRDKPGMWAAIERARTLGEPFDPAEWVRSSTSMDFKPRPLGAEESEGSSGEG